jgi:acyl-coenzyme A synthetase/AMP-(fatty) acid ligase
MRDVPGIGLAYRTGDIVRVDDSDNLVYVGRGDQQIKTRGYRVELGEVEAALLSLAEVVEAACVAVPDEQIGARIEAYVVPAPGAEGAELGRLTLDLLPRYMVPARFAIVESLPRTSTGKIDRQVLHQRSLPPTTGAVVGS